MSLTIEQQEIYDAVMAELTERSSVDSLQTVSAVGNEDTSLPVVNSEGQLVTILIGTLVGLAAQNLSLQLSLWAGQALPTTDPGSSQFNKTYLACTSGTYTNFLDEQGHSIVLADGEVALIRRTETYWVKETLALLNKAAALAAADNANSAAAAVNAWFGADDSQGIRKTWADWFSDTIATGVRKVWSEWYATAQSAWSTWFGASASDGVRKTWSDWYSSVQSAWNTWFGASASDGVRKTWSDWYSSVQSTWTDWFGADASHGVRGTFSSWFSEAVSSVTAAVSSANSAASSANDAAQNLTTLRQNCTDATASAIAAAQSANEATAQVESVIQGMVAEAAAAPVKMDVELLDSISLKNKVQQSIVAKLYPTYVGQNVMFQKVSGGASVNPSGQLTFSSAGTSVFYVVPTQNTSLWKQVSVVVRQPSIRLTSTGKMRLNGNRIRIS